MKQTKRRRGRLLMFLLLGIAGVLLAAFFFALREQGQGQLSAAAMYVAPYSDLHIGESAKIADQRFSGSATLIGLDLGRVVAIWPDADAGRHAVGDAGLQQRIEIGVALALDDLLKLCRLHFWCKGHQLLRRNRHATIRVPESAKERLPRDYRM